MDSPAATYNLQLHGHNPQNWPHRDAKLAGRTTSSRSARGKQPWTFEGGKRSRRNALQRADVVSFFFIGFPCVMNEKPTEKLFILVLEYPHTHAHTHAHTHTHSLSLSIYLCLASFCFSLCLSTHTHELSDRLLRRASVRSNKVASQQSLAN